MIHNVQIRIKTAENDKLHSDSSSSSSAGGFRCLYFIKFPQICIKCGKKWQLRLWLPFGGGGNAKTSPGHNFSLSVCPWSYSIRLRLYKMAQRKYSLCSNSFEMLSLSNTMKWRKFCQTKSVHIQTTICGWRNLRRTFFLVRSLAVFCFGCCCILGGKCEFAFQFVSTFSRDKMLFVAKWSIIKLNYLMINLGMHILKVYKVEEVQFLLSHIGWFCLYQKLQGKSVLWKTLPSNQKPN